MPQPRKRSAVLPWLAVIAWAAVIFGFSSLHGSQVPGRFSVEGHLSEYAVFGVLLWWAFGGARGGWKPVVAAIVVASLYGISDEWHQSFVPGRTPDPLDWATDTAAAAVAVLACWAIARSRANRRSSAEKPGASDGP